jgi:hypothetical protein
VLIRVCGIFSPFWWFLLSPLSLKSRADLMQLLDDAAPRSSSYPHNPPNHIPNSLHDELHYVQHYSSESGFFLTTFGAFDLHAAAAPPWTFLADMMGHRPCSREEQTCALLIKPRPSVPLLLHCRSLHRPLNLTPTARSGCGLHSLVYNN